jgi:hypothetical protein
MGVAGGIRAVRFVLDRLDEPQNPRAINGLVYAQAVRSIQARERLSLSMAGIARLRLLIHKLPYFLRVRGKSDLAFVIENAYAADARLMPDGVDDVENFFSLVAQHRITDAAPDDITGSVCALKNHLLLREAPKPQMPIPVQAQ